MVYILPFLKKMRVSSGSIRGETEGNGPKEDNLGFEFSRSDSQMLKSVERNFFLHRH
jgi:hypothetical protein